VSRANLTKSCSVKRRREERDDDDAAADDDKMPHVEE